MPMLRSESLWITPNRPAMLAMLYFCFSISIFILKAVSNEYLFCCSIGSPSCLNECRPYFHFPFKCSLSLTSHRLPHDVDLPGGTSDIISLSLYLHLLKARKYLHLLVLLSVLLYGMFSASWLVGPVTRPGQIENEGERVGRLHNAMLTKDLGPRLLLMSQLSAFVRKARRHCSSNSVFSLGIAHT